MPICVLYSHPYRKLYKASFCSKAACFQLITFILIIVCPLLMAYRSQGFWMKINTYREKPSVQFKYDYLVYLQGNRSEEYWIWTNFPGLVQLEDSHLRIPVMKVYEPDSDRDGKCDRLELNLEFPMNADENVHDVWIMLLFDYQLELYSKFRMQTMIYGKYESANGGVAFNLDGDMRIWQKTPLSYGGIDQRHDIPVVNKNSLQANSFRIPNILRQYQSRNLTTRLESVTTSWTPGYAGVSGVFRMNIQINYSTDTFEYWTGFWELIKWAWIQYLSILIIFVFVMNRIREYVFRNRLVTSLAVPDQQLINAAGGRGMG